jgi:hypothetical protein
VSHDTFEKLVTDDNDFVGMVAYTIYKRQKIEWIDAFKQHNNQDPDANQLASGFMSVSTMPSQMDAYKEQALTLVNNFLEATLSEKAQELQDGIRHDAVVQAVSKGFWRGVWQNIFAGAIASIFTLSLALILWAAVQGPEKLFKEALQSYLGKKDSPSQTQTGVKSQAPADAAQ